MLAALPVTLLLALAGALDISFPDCDSPAGIEKPDGREAGWVDPRLRGGRMLNIVGHPRNGEPLNVIVSGKSDPDVLGHSGFLDYARSIGFSNECLGLHIGQIQLADLGDGLGLRGEQLLVRQTFRRHIPFWGTTCWESFAGGNHFRAYKQNGTLANTSAWFLTVSKEHSGKDHHAIVQDGYNIGRDLLVARAISPDVQWKAEVQWVQGLMDPGLNGLNHRIPVDGLVAVLTVSKRGPGDRPWKSFWSALRWLIPWLPS
ncbi:hypothetical protein AURDEDRAFT_65052 [Auricularia subglabra TFB-10046 SS5]|nr:hypothetical protein AURDEDRAFT_65052 [Auricularia subglabra TFB-10046 SS5]